MWRLSRGKQSSTLLMLGAFLLLAPVVFAEQSDCLSCHKNAASVLKSGHPGVKTFSMDACLGCHKPADNTLPSPNAFFSRLHRPHVDVKGTISCGLCHGRRNSGGFALEHRDGVKKYDTLSEEDKALVRSKFSSWARSAYLDAAHGKANVGCAGCHGTKTPGKGTSAESARCMACHGFYECLADKTAPKDFPERNPHSSHLGQPECTLCHKGHTVSKSACLNCHREFSMKIPKGDSAVR